MRMANADCFQVRKFSAISQRNTMKRIPALALIALVTTVLLAFCETLTAQSSSPDYDITTLAGKVASVNGTAGLQIRFSSFIEQEADFSDNLSNPDPNALVMPANLLNSPLDPTSVGTPNVTVNQDTATAPQNETAIAVDPNNPKRIVGGLNDYVTTTWSCFLGNTPCSAFGDGYSGTYFSNDGGATWCCASKLDGSNIGTLIPGVTHLT